MPIGPAREISVLPDLSEPEFAPLDQVLEADHLPATCTRARPSSSTETRRHLNQAFPVRSRAPHGDIAGETVVVSQPRLCRLRRHESGRRQAPTSPAPAPSNTSACKTPASPTLGSYTWRGCLGSKRWPQGQSAADERVRSAVVSPRAPRRAADPRNVHRSAQLEKLSALRTSRTSASTSTIGNYTFEALSSAIGADAQWHGPGEGPRRVLWGSI